jgi:hypothetical protein
MRKLKLWHFCQHGSADTTSAIHGALRVLCVLDGREVLPLLRSEGREWTEPKCCAGMGKSARMRAGIG